MNLSGMFPVMTVAQVMATVFIVMVTPIVSFVTHGNPAMGPLPQQSPAIA